MHEDNGMKEFKEKSATLPCKDCIITWMQAGLEYPDGTVADAGNGMWLHHTVFSNLARQSQVCPTKKYGDRFFASGNERTPVNICVDGKEKAGYYIGPNDQIGMVAELMNMAMEPREAILTMSYEYIPAVPKGFSKVKSYWLDIGGCGSSSFPAEKKGTFEYSSPMWISNTTGRITFVASHLHDGGTHTEIRKNGKVICDSTASYGMCSDQKVHISHISECTRLGAVRPGDEWSLTAYYNTSKHTPMTNMDGSLEPIMGISLIYVAEGIIHHHHRALKIVLSCSIVVAAIVLVVGLMKMKGKSFREMFLGTKRGIRLGDIDGRGSQPLLSEEDQGEEN